MTLADALDRGRAAFDRSAWTEAYTALEEASRQAPLEPQDLVRLGTAAALTGHDDEEILVRAYQEFVGRDDVENAARCAFWMGMRLQNAGETARAGGWLARARRILEEARRDCAEQGYVLLPLARQLLEQGDLPRATTTFEEALRIGQRFREADLLALAQLGLGSCRVRDGAAAEGLAYLDEAMVAVEAREVSPLVAGILYCAVISQCHEAFDLRRAQDWTSALSRWCAAQPEIVPFRGECEVHRAQVFQLHGAWPAAMDIARSLLAETTPRPALRAAGLAFYQKAELHRLRGEFGHAEDAYRQASRWGHLPEPGLALMRAAQGQVELAATTIARALDEAAQRSARSRLLPAYVDIMLAAGEKDAARRGAPELEQLAAEFDSPFLRACSGHASGAVLLAEGDARAALSALRMACEYWQQLDAPYEAARTRELIGLASRALGDHEHAQLDLDAAAWTFRQLGATPDLARVESHSRTAPPRGIGGLSPRELEVLRLLAAGMSNRAIAVELVLSEKTVARHVSNIFTKLGLSSRSAATAYAYQHDLVQVAARPT